MPYKYIQLVFMYEVENCPKYSGSKSPITEIKRICLPEITNSETAGILQLWLLIKILPE